jgi:hypothetical protein
MIACSSVQYAMMLSSGIKRRQYDRRKTKLTFRAGWATLSSGGSTKVSSAAVVGTQ